MNLDTNQEIARRWYEEMWSKPDLDIADEIIDPAYDPDWVHIPAKGPEQIKHEIRYFRSVFPDLLYKVVEMTAQQDKVWVRYQASGRQQGSAWGFEATGRFVSFEGAAILTFNSDGKIIDRWGAFSFYDILVDLELAPPLWELRSHLSWKRE